MPRFWFWQCLWVALSLPWAVVGQHLGASGLPGQRTPRTGAVWPPYEGAGQGYWARQAGFSLPFQQQQEQMYTEQRQQQIYAQQLQQQQIYAQRQQQLPEIGYTQAVELTTDQLRAQQRALMQKYLISAGNEVLTSAVQPKLLTGAGQNLYRFSTVDGSLAQVELQAAVALP